jgi:streptogramin lyase
MRRLAVGLGAASFAIAAFPVGRPALVPAAPSSAWIELLPDGPTRRQFIIDCTGCHQFDARTASVDGRARTEAEWRDAVARMLSFAGPETGFPVISGAQHPDSTARWLARALEGHVPQAEPPKPDPRVTEFLFPVPQDLPHDIAIDDEGQVVVTGMFSGAMYRLDPASGAFARIEIPIEGANPRAVEIDREGRWWVVLGNPQQLARYDGVNWSFTSVGVYAHSVALDSSGRAWVNGHFTRDPALLVSVDRNGAAVRVELPRHPELATRPGGPIPYELRAGPDGKIWMSELQGNRIVSFDPASGASRTYELPRLASGPRRFDVALDGTLWIPAYGAGTLVRLEPESGRMTEIALPVPASAPYVARMGRDGEVWIGTGAADVLFRYDPRSGGFETIPLPTRGALVRHLAVDRRTGDVWLAYGESPGKVPARIARYRPSAR